MWANGDIGWVHHRLLVGFTNKGYKHRINRDNDDFNWWWYRHKFRTSKPETQMVQFSIQHCGARLIKRHSKNDLISSHRLPPKENVDLLNPLTTVEPWHWKKFGLSLLIALDCLILEIVDIYDFTRIYDVSFAIDCLIWVSYLTTLI